MSIQNASVPIGATYTPSGGTATTMIDKGNAQAGQTSVILDNSATFQLQTGLNFTVKEPKASLNAPGGYTQARASVYITVPFILDNGSRTVNTVKVEIAHDPELVDSEVDDLLELAAHLVLDADYADFWHKKSLA